MNTYAQIRNSVTTGDVMLVEGKGVIGTAIRVLTGQQFSHVAMAVWLDGGLWIAEMKEGKGFQLMPASQWFAQQSGQVYWGVAPEVVQVEHERIAFTVIQDRADPAKYSYWSLVTIWLSQLLRRKTTANLVCSTYVQHKWEQCGVVFAQTADPGDIAPHCQAIYPINDHG